MNRLFCILLIYSVLLWAETANQGKAYEYFLKGEYALLHNNFPQAESDLSKALSIAPDSPTILQSLVDLKSNQGEYSEAIKYLEMIIELTPENKESGLKLFQLYIQEGNMDYAHELLNNLTKYYPSDIELLYARA